MKLSGNIKLSVLKAAYFILWFYKMQILIVFFPFKDSKHRKIFVFAAIIIYIIMGVLIVGFHLKEAALAIAIGAAIIPVILITPVHPKSSQPTTLRNMHINELFRDPLHETTRRLRRNLLIATSIGLVMAVGDVQPSKISFLGVTFDAESQNSIPLLVSFIIAYMILAFSIYVRSDVISVWLCSSEEPVEVKASVILRVFFETVVPVGIAAVSIYYLMSEYIINVGLG